VCHSRCATGENGGERYLQSDRSSRFTYPGFERHPLHRTSIRTPAQRRLIPEPELNRASGRARRAQNDRHAVKPLAINEMARRSMPKHGDCWLP
jgi:hypothetical protein